MDKKTCIIDEVNKEWGHNKGALYVIQYLPTSVKRKPLHVTTALLFQAQLPCPTHRIKEKPCR